MGHGKMTENDAQHKENDVQRIINEKERKIC